MAAIPEILDELDIDGLKRLCDIRELRRSGTRSSLEKSLAASYRGDVDTFLSDLRKDDLKRALQDEWNCDAGDFEYKYLGQATVEQLRTLASKAFVDDWSPSEDGQQPLGRNCPITIQFLRADEAGDDFDDWFGDDEDDDPNEEDDDEPERYGSAEYAARLQSEFLATAAHERDIRGYQRDALIASQSHLDAQRPILLNIGTGGGKTFVANELVRGQLSEGGGPVLWVTKDWQLLKQAARDLSRRRSATWDQLTRIGGANRILHPLVEYRRQKNCVIYTTLQTLSRRRLVVKPKLVVWDECHWAEHGKTGQRLLKKATEWNAPVLGLTATPRRPESSKFHIVYTKSFKELVDEKALAKPNAIEPVKTGMSWQPQVWNERIPGSDFAQQSLEELASNPERNRLIVDHYIRGNYGKTILFACNVGHADRLARLLNEKGVTARPIHSRLSHQENGGTLAAFERNEVRVLVNVAKLIYGVDIPDAQTVFLCRPTLSDILFSQMIGRASRLDAATGKETFNIVEFSDNLTRFGDQLQTAKEYFDGAAKAVVPSSTVSPRPTPATRMPLEFDPLGACRWIGDHAPIPEEMRGLWLREGQTFGVEFELTGKQFSQEMDRNVGSAWHSVAESLRSALATALPGKVANSVYSEHHPDKSFSVWNVEYDASAGWEVTSRKLRNQAGYEEVVIACQALEDARKALDLRLSHRTGTHVHLGWLGKDTAEVVRAIRLARLFEPALATLVSPSRIAEFADGHYDTTQPNVYCQPVSAVFTRRKLDQVRSRDDIWRICEGEDARYVSFNVRPLNSYQTVEARLHNGTLDAGKILLWLSLWQQLLWAAAHHSVIEDVEDTSALVPTGDIVQLAEKYLPQVHRRLLLRLDTRRSEVVDTWKQYPELEPWVEFSKCWSSPTRLYFAYGSNLDSDQLRERAPRARLLGAAHLPHYDLAFAGSSIRWGGATATLRSSASSIVPGLVHELTDADFDALDRAEGSRYSCREVDVVDAFGTTRRAFTYLLRDDEPDGTPARAYHDLMITAYARLGFDAEHLRRAIRIGTTADDQ